MTAQIKPCPFCGNNAYLMNTLKLDCEGDQPNCFVACMECAAEGPHKDFSSKNPSNQETKQTEQAAIDEWNNRSEFWESLDCDAVQLDVTFIDKHLDTILHASGSGLKYYSLHKTIEEMRDAMKKAMKNAIQTAIPQFNKI